MTRSTPMDLNTAGGSQTTYTIADVPTPAMIIDVAVMQDNIDRLAHYARGHKLGIRPHTKTHKSLALARRQIDSGAIGLTVAKVGEAQIMAGASHDLLLAYPAADLPRTRQLAQLAGACDLKVAVDSAFAAEALAAEARRAGTTIAILVDLDVGLGRTGLQSDTDALALAQQVERLQGLRLAGLFCYPGHVWLPVKEQGPALLRVAEKLDEALDLWRRHGLSAAIVSGGSTPTAYQSHLIQALTEIRPGTYIFNDMNTVKGGLCEIKDCAARIICTVVSNAVHGQVVLDAGSKTLTSDRCIPAPDSGHGYVVEYPQATIKALSEEHGQVDVRDCDRQPRLGERMTVIPNHICPCVNLQDNVWLMHNVAQPLELLRVDARGRLS